MSLPDVSRIAASAPAEKHPTLRPVDAATLVLIDRSRRTPRVLMGKRSPKLKFMPGKLVFPGGRVDPEDRRMPVYGMLESETERRLLAGVVRPSPARSRALALAAIRETFEETGLMLGTQEAGAPEGVPAGWSAFAEAGVFPNLEALTLVARAITPPGRIRRFDTRFFLADLADIAHRVDGIVGPDAELVELDWLTFAEAKKAELPNITRAIVEEVETRLNAGNSVRLPVPFYFMRRGRFHRETLD